LPNMSEEKEESQISDPRVSAVTFAANTSPDASTNNKPASKKNPSRRSSLRSSFFRLKSLAFRKSGGETGADVNTLRGSHGPDFEGYATIKRAGGMGVSCGCFGGDDEKKEKIILIKGAYCFVFDKESDAAPKYAISLVHMKAKLQSPSHGMYHVTIEASLGDVDWELGFEQKPIAQQFVDAFRHRAAVGEADEVRKRLGHDKLAPKRGSVMYAENIAQKKLEDQPEKRENILLEDSNRADADIMMTAAY